MEFRNHQARILHTFTALRANPIGLVIALLLLPVFLGLLVVFALVATAFMLLTLAVNAVLSVFSGGSRGSRGGRGPGPPPDRPADPRPGAGPTIDVEVVRRDP